MPHQTPAVSSWMLSQTRFHAVPGYCTQSRSRWAFQALGLSQVTPWVYGPMSYRWMTSSFAGDFPRVHGAARAGGAAVMNTAANTPVNASPTVARRFMGWPWRRG